MPRRLYIDALRDGLAEALAADERVYVVGEDIVDPYGGAFKVTKSLSTRFPGRLIAVPMSEQAFTGLGVGMALGGLKPIVEIMFGDFLTLALDQIVNHASKFVGLYGSELNLVIRTPMGGHRGYGATHSQSIERITFGVPHVSVVAPSVLHDPGPLLGASLALGTPVVFIENKLDYGRHLAGPDELHIERSVGPFGLAVAEHPDADEPDAVIIAYGGAVAHAIEAQHSLFMDEEIGVRIVNPSLVSLLDATALIRAIGGCDRVLVAEEGIADFGWGEHVATVLREAGYSGAIKRVGARSEVIGASARYEEETLLHATKIRESIGELIAS